jgi:hypothetical protein
MNAAQMAPKTIDDYIAACPPEAQAPLEQIRTTIRETVPEARETIRYGMPTFTLNERYLVYFGAYKIISGCILLPLALRSLTRQRPGTAQARAR